MLASDLVCQLAAIHWRHDDVGQQQANVGALVNDLKSRDWSIYCNDAVAEFFQHLGVDLTDTGVVLHQQDGFARGPSRHTFVLHVGRDVVRAIVTRQVDFHRRAGSDL